MDIVVDTNVLWGDYFCRSSRMQSLFDFLKREKSALIIPRVVYEELLNLFEHDLQDRLKKLTGAQGKLKQILSKPEDIVLREVEVDEEVERLKKFYTGNFDSSLFKLIDYSKVEIAKLVDMAVRRVKPFKGNDKGFRDAVLWLSLLKYFETCGSSLIFISRNIHDFCGPDKQNLHPQLQKMVQGFKSDLLFYPSVDDFLRNKSVKVEGIDKTWLNKALLDTDIEDRIISIFEDDKAGRVTELIYQRWEEATGWFEIEEADIKVDDFFIYKLMNENLYLSVKFSGCLGIRVETQVEEFLESLSYEHETWNPEIIGELSLKIIDGQVADIKVEEVDIDISWMKVFTLPS
ncbi:MAG: DUF4935 domain-containing protein [candidate division Zixibacteria bacterium]|nr:DUF4935 domain-containing protein [candidate division Zixibacteria bacterium]